jgi:hypothetical protein
VITRGEDSPSTTCSAEAEGSNFDDDSIEAFASASSSESPVDQRTRIAREILETEQYYIQSLNVLIEVCFLLDTHTHTHTHRQTLTTSEHIRYVAALLSTIDEAGTLES